MPLVRLMQEGLVHLAKDLLEETQIICKVLVMEQVVVEVQAQLEQA